MKQLKFFIFTVFLIGVLLGTANAQEQYAFNMGVAGGRAVTVPIVYPYCGNDHSPNQRSPGLDFVNVCTATTGYQGLAFDGTNYYIGDNVGTEIYAIAGTNCAAAWNADTATYNTEVDIREDHDSLLVSANGTVLSVKEISKSDGSAVRSWDFSAEVGEGHLLTYGTLVAYFGTDTILVQTQTGSSPPYGVGKIGKYTVNDNGTYTWIKTWDIADLGTPQGLEYDQTTGYVYYSTTATADVDNRIYKLTLNAGDTDVTIDSYINVYAGIASGHREVEGIALYNGWLHNTYWSSQEIHKFSLAQSFDAPAITGNLVCEIFDGTADGAANWADGTSNCTHEFNATPDDAPELNCNTNQINTSYAFEHTKTAGTASACRSVEDTGGEPSALYAQFYIKILSEGLADTNRVGMVNFAQATNGTSNAIFTIYQAAGGALKFELGHYVSSFTWDLGGTAIALDTWYGVRIALTTAGTDQSQWWVKCAQTDCSSAGYTSSWTDEVGTSGTFGRGMRYVILGETSTSYNFSLNYQIRGLKVDNTTMPGDCAAR